MGNTGTDIEEIIMKTKTKRKRKENNKNKRGHINNYFLILSLYYLYYRILLINVSVV